MLLQHFHEHWSAYCTRQGIALNDKTRTCLLAVSGGCDSMVMASLFRESSIPFAVAHCNYSLRGTDSDLDEQLVREWCMAHDIPFYSTKFDTKQKAAEWKAGIQETARILRYEWFEQLRDTHHYYRIATAHHANDNVETLLINLFRGTGISGMHGILPENGYIIRPMLFAQREDITAYARDNRVPYRDDASNATDDYLRNAIRHHIIPVAKEWFPNAVVNVNESIARIAEAEILYRQAIELERKKLVEQRGQDHYIPIRKLQHRQPLTTIVYELLLPFGFSPAQVPQVLGLLQSQSGHYVASATHRVIRNRDFLIVTALPSEMADMVVVEAAPCVVNAGKYTYSFSIQDKPRLIPAHADEAYIDIDSITFPLFLRKWKTGDYLYPLGMGMKKKKVSRLLIDEKIPLHEKEDIRILECNRRVVWVSGLRIDERFKVTDKTTRVLVVKRALLSPVR